MSAPIIIVLCGLGIMIIFFAYYKRFFKGYHLTDNKGSCILVGQIKHGISSAQLPNPLGRHVYTITTNGGSLRINHNALNPDGFTWSAPPGHGEKANFEVIEKVNNTFTITIRESFGRPDKVEVVNPHFRDDVEFFYKID